MLILKQLDDGACGPGGADRRSRSATVTWLLFTMALGLTFLVVKFFEYKEKFE